MGVLDWFTRSIPQTQIPDRYAVQTPWENDNLTANVILAEAFGITTNIATRQNAMSVPAIAKARHIITSTVAAAIWRAYKDDSVLQSQPPFLYRTNSQLTPVHRMIWTVDDLLFYGWSLWVVTRASDKAIIDAVRIPRSRWDFDEVGRVKIDGHYPNDDEIVLIPASNEGLLQTASETILGALNIEREWQKRIRNPIAVTELHNTDANDPLDPEESKALVTRFNESRKTDDGITAYTPANIEIRTHGTQVVDLFVNGRNAVALDIARHTGLPAIVLDTANINAANQNYSNKETARNDLIDAIRNIFTRHLGSGHGDRGTQGGLMAKKPLRKAATAPRKAEQPVEALGGPEEISEPLEPISEVQENEEEPEQEEDEPEEFEDEEFETELPSVFDLARKNGRVD